MICSTQLGGSRVQALPAASVAAPRPCLIGGRPSRRVARSWARSQRDRDHDGERRWDDPHQTSPPHGAAEQPPAGGASFQAHRPHDSVHTSDFSSLATSDLEFGNDAITGSTLETPQQEARWHERQHEKAERLHQADIAREAYEEAGEALFMNEDDVREAREEARRELVKDESTAEEREERYAGILEAIDELAVDERMSPDAARLTVSGSGEEPETEFDVIRHTVDELGEGQEAAELIMRSYQGRNLEAEALETVDPSDTTGMPHPGDKYLRPHAVPIRSPPLPPGAARLHQLHSGPDFEGHRALLLARARGGGSSGQGQQQQQQQQQQGQGGGRSGSAAAPAAVPAAAAAAAAGGAAEGGWLPPVPPVGAGEDVDSLLRGARAAHDPVGYSSPEELQGAVSSRGYEASSEGDDQIGLGAAAGEAGGSGAPAEASDDQIGFDEQEALQGADAMYYTEGDRHAAAAEPVPVNNEGVPPPPSSAPRAPQAEQGEVFDIEKDALQGSDAMFYYQSAGGSGSGGGGRRRRSAEEALRSGAVWGALRSTDEQHSSFRRAMETPSAERKRPGGGSSSKGGAAGPAAAGPAVPNRRGQPPPAAAAGAAVPAERDSSGPVGTAGDVLESRDELHSSFHRAMAEGAAVKEAARSAAAADTTRRYAAEASGKRRAGAASPAPAQATQPAPSNGAAAAAGSVGDANSTEGSRSDGILASLRRQQEEHSRAQRSLAGLGARAKSDREPPPPPPVSLGRVLEVAVGRAAVAGLGSAAVSELLTQQSVMSQLLGRFEGPRQIELAIPLAQSAALGVVVAVVLLTAAERWASRSGTSPSWRPLGLSPATQVWLGRGAMALFALLLAYETMHSNRPAFGTLFYLWF